MSTPADEPMVRCARCGDAMPPLPYCVRCGNPSGRALARRGVRPEFAAAPHEGLSGLHIISTIFPQLPRADMESFRIALLMAAAVMVALAAIGLFPAALAAAAIAVPVLMAIYLRDVDIYEDEPVPVLAFTMAWGAVGGIVVALVVRAVQPSAVALGAGDDASYLLTAGVVLPVLKLALMLAGPLALLRYPKFNDVLDGATFGASSAVSFLGAGALLAAFDYTRAGVAPPGETLPRIVVLMTLGIVLPLLVAGAAGSALGSIWLRSRSSLRSPGVLGVLGNPAVALLAAAALYVLASLAMLLLPGTAALVVLLLLAGVSLAWLRLIIHLGLLDEAGEMAIGPPVRCANCGRMTPRHTFCGDCGVALRALPKGGGSHGDS